MRWSPEFRASLYASFLLLLPTCSTVSAQQTESEIEHLIQAASHLQQAGYGQLAAEVRQLAAGHDPLLTQRLLEAKRAQMAGLQAEIEQLQLSLQPVDGVPQVTLRLRVLQLSMGRLRDFGFGLVSIRQLLESDSPSSLLDDSGDIVQFLEFIEAQGFAEVVASPTLVTADGLPARFRIGGPKPAVRETDVANGNHKTERSAVPQDVRFECTPTILPNGKLRLKATFRGSSQRLPGEADLLDNVAEPKREQSLLPGSSSQEAGTLGQSSPNDTLVDMARGQTLILACPASVATTGGTQATLVLLQAEAAKSPEK